jgi:hypothetical protein
MRWLAAAVLVIGPLFQAIEFLLVGEAGDTAARLAFWIAHPLRTELSMTSGLLAVPFLLGAVAVLVALTRKSSPRLAWVAGAFMTFAMLGLAAIHGYEFSAYNLAQSGDLAAATAVLDASQPSLTGMALLLMFLGGAVVGTLTLSAAIWRSPLVPRIAAVFTLAFAVLDFAVGTGVVSHLVNLAGFAIVAGAVIAGYTRR